MTVLKYHDGSAWVTPPLSQGPQGPAGASGIGALLAVQRQYGRNEAYISHGTSAVIYCNPTGTEVMRLNYTPTVDCWWDVSANIGLIACDTTSYVYRIVQLLITPLDADGIQGSQEYEEQHQQVQTYTFSQMQHCFKLSSGIAYKVEAGFSFNGGAWRIYQGPAQLNMEGRVFSR